MIQNTEDILGKPVETINFSTFADFTPYERQMIMAELYHNAWYDQDRFEDMYDLYNKWTAEPVRECKFVLPEYQDKANEFKDNDRIEINPIGDVTINSSL